MWIELEARMGNVVAVAVAVAVVLRRRRWRFVGLQ